MNAIFGHHAIVTLDICADCMTLRTLDAQHGRSCRMFIDGDKLHRWLDKPTTKEDIPAIFYRHYPTYAAKKMNVSELARVCGLSRPTVYKYLRLLE